MGFRTFILFLKGTVLHDYEQDFETPLLWLYSMSLVKLIFILILEKNLVSDSLVFIFLFLCFFVCFHLHF